MADKLILVNGVAVGISYLRGNTGAVITTANGTRILLYAGASRLRPTVPVRQVAPRCCPYRGGAVESRIVRLCFKRSQLLYDIQNYAYVESDMMDEKRKGVEIDINHAKHLTADIGEEGNVDRVSRKLQFVYMDAVEMLYPYTKTEIEAEEIVDDLTEPDQYVIEMSVPVTASRTTLIHLSTLIHEYMVCSCVADWLAITNPQAAVSWREKAEEAKSETNQWKVLRSGPLTRAMSPF